MTLIDDHEDRTRSSISRRPETRAAGRWNSAGVPGERSKDFKNALRRLGRHARADVGRARASSPSSRSSSATLNVFGPRVLGHGTDIIVQGVIGHQRHRLRRAAPRAVPGGRALRGVVGAVDRRRVHARRRHPAADVQAALRRRGQGQRAAAQLHRQAVARRPAEPGHQRHRQRRAEPAADAEPDAHVGAAAHRHRDHDVHDLAAARGRRAHDRAGVGVGHARRRAAGPAQVHLAVEEHRAAQRADRGDVHRPRGREGVRSPARGRAAVPRHQRRALRVVVRRAVHVEPDAAVHDVHGQHPVRDRRRRRRPAGGERRDHASATSRRSSSTRASSRCRSRSWRR